MAERSTKPRSACPVSISLEKFGDRWSLLIIRDLMVRGLRTFKEFRESGEGIATNILTNRLKRLEAAGIVRGETEDADRRRVNYRLTEKGIDLAPLLLELLIWGARHEDTGAPCAVIDKMATRREQVLAEVRRRWRERDPTPFLPSFANHETSRGSLRRPKPRARRPIQEGSIQPGGDKDAESFSARRHAAVPGHSGVRPGAHRKR